jgi:hypothetical protein
MTTPGFAITGIVVRHNVDTKHARQVIEPIINHAQIFGIAVRKQNGHRRTGPFNEKGWNATAVRRVQPKVSTRMQIRGWWWLKEE